MPSEETLDLYFIMANGLNVVFHPPSVTFFRVDCKAATVLKSYTEGYNIETCAAMHGCTFEEVKFLLQKFREGIERQTAWHPASMIEPKDLPGRLTLLVSQDCNLRCVYCYADGGNYGKVRQLMSKEVAIQAVDLFIKSEEFHCSNIMFFGGEPSLNVPVIRVVCEHLAEMVESGRLSHLPRLGMVTNGVYLSDELLSLITEYNMEVTVSLDGPSEVNDLLRVDVGGKGTYRRVTRSIRRLQQATNGRAPEMLEATITRRHSELGITYDVLTNFFATELGVTRHYIGIDTSVSDEEWISWDIARWTSMLDKLVQGEFAGHNIRVLRTLVSREIMPYICPVGFSMLLVDAEGGIYPCSQLLYDPFYMGNVFELGVLASDRFRRVQKAFRANGKYEHSQCCTCWARALCMACPGQIYARTGALDGRVDAMCTAVKKSLETILLELARLRTDKLLWPQILEKLDRETKAVDKSFAY